MRYPDPLDKAVPAVVSDYRVPVFSDVAASWGDRHLAMQYVETAHASDLALAGERREVHVALPGPS